jgi:hypothetical protein
MLEKQSLLIRESLSRPSRPMAGWEEQEAATSSSGPHAPPPPQRPGSSFNPNAPNVWSNPKAGGFSPGGFAGQGEGGGRGEGGRGRSSSGRHAGRWGSSPGFSGRGRGASSSSGRSAGGRHQVRAHAAPCECPCAPHAMQLPTRVQHGDLTCALGPWHSRHLACMR